ncbi:MAG: ABC transporter permease [Acetilactobacillus jinshanensis]
MWSLIQRNLLLYFKNKGRVFFSLIGALIGFFLYLIFLQNTIKADWTKVPDATKLLDLWLISGVLAITAITTTLNALCQMIRDRESYRINDLMLTDQSNLAIQFSYLLSSVIIGTLMQLVSFVIMEIYFQWADKIHFNLALFPKILGVMILSSLVWTAFGILILSFVHKVESLGLINTIISAAAGFFVCVYIPLGEIPKSAQTFIKFTPAPYNAAIYRKILMKAQFNQSFKNIPIQIFNHFKDYMGIKLSALSLDY